MTGYVPVKGGKRVLMVVAPKEFRDEELVLTREVLEEGGVVVSVASTKAGTAKGELGTNVDVDLVVGDVDPLGYDAIAVVGGGGAETYLWNDKGTHRILRLAFRAERVVAAICLGSVVLANAGILKGKRATVFPASEAIEEMRRGGAKVSDPPVEVDQNIVTAKNHEAAREFGRIILEKISAAE